MRHVPPKRPYFFSLAFTERPHFYQLSPNGPLFLTNSLSPKDLDTTLSLKDPSFSHLIVKQVTIFGKKLNFPKIWRNVEKFLAILALKAPIFVCISLKDPLFLCNLSPKTPASEVLGGTRTSLWYVSAPPPPPVFLTFFWCFFVPRYTLLAGSRSHTMKNTALSLVFSTNVVCVKTQQKHDSIKHHVNTKQ